MRIRGLVHQKGLPFGTLLPDKEVDVDDNLAAKLIEFQWAEPVDPPKKSKKAADK